MKPGSPYCIAYGEDRDLIKSMEDAMTAKVGYPPSDYYQIGPEIAANTGPRVVGVIFYRQ